jgi:GT2 family glycosyltransferase
MPILSVVVATFNRRAGLQRLLASLAEQTLPAEQFEVVVVDDGSTDGTVEATRVLAVPYARRVLEQPHSGAPAAGRNLGVANARGDIIVFLDDDVVPTPDLLERHVQAHGSDRDSVVIGPMLPPGDWPRPPWVRWEEEKLLEQYRAMSAGEFECTPRQFFTANASLRRGQFLDAGGFDLRFKRAEDVELAYRLRNLGARFMFEPRAQIWHYASRSFAAWCRTPYQYGRYDVAMDGNDGQEAWECATHEFHGRHLATRLLTRLCVGHPGRLRTTVAVLGLCVRAADRMGMWRVTSLALSALFSLLYWQGAADELGDAHEVWRAVAGSAPVAA